MPSICLVYGFVVALWWLWVALRGLRAWLSPPASGGCPKLHSSRIHRHWPVRVKAAQKKGFWNSSEWSRDNCASRQAFVRGSPERQRRMNSVINWLGGLVVHLPMARQHGLRAGVAEGPAVIGKNERIGCDETIKPTPRTAALPARGPSLRPPPASRAGSRICSGCASP